MKKFNKILSLLLAVTMLFTVTSRIAADNYDPGLDGKDVGNGGKIEINKYLVITGEVDVPDASYTFEVSYPTATDPNTGAYINATATNPVVYPGVGKLLVTTSTNNTATEDKNTLSFSSADATEDGPLNVTNKPQGESNYYGDNSKGSADDVVIEADQKYVRKTVTLNFDNNITFTEPGVYRYWLEEIPDRNNPQSLSDDTQIESTDNNHRRWRTIDVYVVDDDTYADGSTYDPNKKITGLRCDGVVIYEGKLTTDQKPGNSVDWTFDITNISTEPLDSDNTLPQSTALNIVDYAWKADGYQYSYISEGENAGKWTKATEGEEVGVVDMVPDHATSEGVADNFKTVYDAKYNAQKAAHEQKLKENGVEAGEKNVAFVNEIEMHNLKVNKTVTGNQGSRDKYFKFEIEIETEHPGTVLTVVRDRHDSDSDQITHNIATPTTANAYPVEEIVAANTRDDIAGMDGYQIVTGIGDRKNFTWNQDNKNYQYDSINQVWVNEEDETDTLANLEDTATCGLLGGMTFKEAETHMTKEGSAKKTKIVVFLQHDEEIEIRNIPKDSTYKITEVDANLDGYTSSIDGDPIENEKSNDNTKVFEGEVGVTFYKDENGKYYLLNEKDENGNYKYTTEAPTSETEANYLNTDKYSKDVTVAYTNNRSGVIPTGVFVAAGTGFAILGVGVVGMLALNRRRDEDDEDEE